MESTRGSLFSPLASQAFLAIWDIRGLTEASPHLCLHPHMASSLGACPRLLPAGASPSTASEPSSCLFSGLLRDSFY